MRCNMRFPTRTNEGRSGRESSGFFYSQAPFLIYWEMTRACDLACRHCRAEANAERDRRELSTIEAEALLERISTFGGRGPHLVMTGGDPHDAARPGLRHPRRQRHSFYLAHRGRLSVGLSAARRGQRPARRRRGNLPVVRLVQNDPADALVQRQMRPVRVQGDLRRLAGAGLRASRRPARDRPAVRVRTVFERHGQEF